MFGKKKKEPQAEPQPQSQDWQQVLVADPNAPPEPVPAEPVVEAIPEAPPEAAWQEVPAEPAPATEEPAADTWEEVADAPVEALPEAGPESWQEVPAEPPAAETVPVDGAPFETVPTEPAPEIAAMEALGSPPTEPATAPASAARSGVALHALTPEDIRQEWGIGPDLDPFVRIEGWDLVVKQSYLPLAKKVDIERRLSRGERVAFKERRWIPYKAESVPQIERQVDALAYQSRYASKSTDHFSRIAKERREALQGLEQIPPNIISKRLVYETDGGFVAEVTYRELGETSKKYFTVADLGDPRRTLAQVKSGAWAKATGVSDALIDALERTGKHSKAPAPPGKIKTWPVLNKWPAYQIHGIAKKTTAQLGGIGVHTTDQLRLQAPRLVARHCNVPLTKAKRWQAEAELLLVKGVGETYAYWLTKAGIRSIEALQTAQPKPLAEAVNKALAKAHLQDGPRNVGPASAKTWIRAAKRMRRKSQPYPQGIA